MIDGDEPSDGRGIACHGWPAERSSGGLHDHSDPWYHICFVVKLTAAQPVA
jgi:hypothetical protein